MTEPAEDALLGRVLDASAPEAVRLAAARGALPLSRVALARVFVHFLGDAVDQVRESARASLEALDGEALVSIFSDPACATEVLDHFARRAARDVSLAERIAFHPAAGPNALTVLAGEGAASVLDLVLTNEERLFTTPGLLDRLTENPALRPDQRGRLLDLLDRMSKRNDAPSLAVDDLPEPEEVSPEEAARLLDLDVGELFAASEILGGEEFESTEDPIVRSAYRRILKLGPGQRAMLAMKGGREERMILVRDSNRVVALSVLKNPRMTDKDVEDIARLRNVSEDVLRVVGSTREWSKRPTVVQILVRNPRTPQGISLNFVGRLAVQDLKDLAKDRNVPELIRRMAKRHLELRTKQTRPLKKH